MAMTVRDVMSTEILTVRASSTLGEVARTLRGRNVGSALVVDADGRPEGLISERELVDSVAASRSPDAGEAGTWMNASFLALASDTALQAANERMRADRQRHAVIVDADGRAVGILSVKDLLAAAMDAA